MFGGRVILLTNVTFAVYLTRSFGSGEWIIESRSLIKCDGSLSSLEKISTGLIWLELCWISILSLFSIIAFSLIWRYRGPFVVRFFDHSSTQAMLSLYILVVDVNKSFCKSRSCMICLRCRISLTHSSVA